MTKVEECLVEYFLLIDKKVHQIFSTLTGLVPSLLVLFHFETISYLITINQEVDQTMTMLTRFPPSQVLHVFAPLSLHLSQESYCRVRTLPLFNPSVLVRESTSSTR